MSLFLFLPPRYTTLTQMPKVQGRRGQNEKVAISPRARTIYIPHRGDEVNFRISSTMISGTSAGDSWPAFSSTRAARFPDHATTSVACLNGTTTSYLPHKR